MDLDIYIYIFFAALGLTKGMRLLTSPTHKQCGSFTLPLTSRVGIILIHTRSVR